MKRRSAVAIVEDLEVLTAFETRVLPELERNIAQFDRLYLTIDLDVLPAREMPAVSAPAALGVPLARCCASLSRCAAAVAAGGGSGGATRCLTLTVRALARRPVWHGKSPIGGAAIRAIIFVSPLRITHKESAMFAQQLVRARAFL